MSMSGVTHQDDLDDELAEIVEEVLDGILETAEMDHGVGGSSAPGSTIEATVHIAGDANAVFTLRAPAETAYMIGAVLLAAPMDSLQMEDACDVMAELTNMIGGIAKSLIAEETYQLIPEVQVVDASAPLPQSIEVFHDLGRFEAHLEYEDGPESQN